MHFSKQYWDNLYSSQKVGWDVGYVSTPLKEYFDQLENMDIRILVPGAGKAWEAEYLFKLGFENTFLLDFSVEAIDEFKSRRPVFPECNIIHEDFFKHNEQYDLIVEQTFFSSFHPAHRKAFVKQMANLLVDEGKYMGLFFNHEFDYNGPPFGGSPLEYKELFEPYFEFLIFETAYNSIKPRKGRELFTLLQKNIGK